MNEKMKNVKVVREFIEKAVKVLDVLEEDNELKAVIDQWAKEKVDISKMDDLLIALAFALDDYEDDLENK